MLREKPEEWQEFSGVAVVARLFLWFVPGWASCDLSKEGVSPRNKRMKRGPGSSAWKCWDVGSPDVTFAIQAPLSCLCCWGGGTQTLEPACSTQGPGLRGLYLGLQAWKEAFSTRLFPKQRTPGHLLRTSAKNPSDSH